MPQYAIDGKCVLGWPRSLTLIDGPGCVDDREPWQTPSTTTTRCPDRCGPGLVAAEVTSDFGSPNTDA